MSKRLSAGEDGTPAIKRPAPANRSHLIKPKNIAQSQSAPPTPATPLDVQKKKDSLKKKPIKPDETDEDVEQAPEESVGTSRGRRSCKDNTRKAWASLMKVPVKPKKPRVEPQEDVENDGDNQAESASSPLPPPPKTYSRPQVARRGGHYSVPLSVANAHVDPRPAPVDVKPGLLEEMEDEEEDEEEMEIPEGVDPHVDEFKVPHSPSTSIGRGFVAGTRGGRQGNATPRAQPRTRSNGEVKSSQKSPAKQGTRATTSKTNSPRRRAPQKSLEAASSAPENSVDYFKDIIVTLQAEVQRVTEHRRSSIEHMEQSYSTLLEVKDRRIRDLEEELGAVQNRLQELIAKQIGLRSNCDDE